MPKEGNERTPNAHFNTLRRKNERRRKSREKQLEEIFVNDHLSTNSRQSLEKAREIRHKGYWQFAWFGNGHVMVHKEEGSRAVHIKKTEDLYKIKKQIENKEEGNKRRQKSRDKTRSNWQGER